MHKKFLSTIVMYSNKEFHLSTYFPSDWSLSLSRVKLHYKNMILCSETFYITLFKTNYASNITFSLLCSRILYLNFVYFNSKSSQRPRLGRPLPYLDLFLSSIVLHLLIILIIYKMNWIVYRS